MNKPINPELIYRKKSSQAFLGNEKTVAIDEEKIQCKDIAHYILASIADKH